MQRHGIPTAAYATFTDAAAAHAYVRAHGRADRRQGRRPGRRQGRGGGHDARRGARGHRLDAGRQQARRAHNAGGARVVIEEFLEGEEASFIVLCDGKNVLPLATSQDHKRLLDGDAGPNTGGMGAYSPAPVVTPNVHARVMHEIILPTMAGMARDGMPFTGFLYAGLMIDAQGQPRTLEFNARLGDPETQPILMRLKSDLFEVLLHATDGTLDQVELQWDRRVALGVVMAAHGYPMAPRKGDAITGLPAAARRPDGLPCRHRAERRPAASPAAGACCASPRWARSVKLAQQRAYEALQRHPLRRRAVPQRHRPPRHQAVTADRLLTNPSTARPVRDYLLGLQRPHRRRLRGRGRQALLSDAWTRPPGGALEGDGLSRLVEEGDLLERGGCNFSHVQGRDAAAVGHAAPARAGRRAVRGDGRVAGLAPAQPVRAHGAHERAHVRRAARGPGAGELVRRRHGPDAVLRRRGGRGALPPQLPRRAGALRRRQVPALQAVVRRVLLPQAPQRAARHRRRVLRRLRRTGLRAQLRDDARRRRRLPAGLPADRAAPPRHALRRARARLPGLPARALRRVQPGVRPRHAVRPAVAAGAPRAS